MKRIKLLTLGVISFFGYSQAKAQSITFNSSSHLHEIVTDYPGMITIGCGNTLDWAHINTTKTKFYIGKPIYVNGAISSYHTQSLNLQTNGITRIFANRYTGFVGIGTTSPSYLFDANGAGRFKGDLRITDATATGNLKLGYNNSLTVGFMDFNHKLYFRSNTNNSIAPLLLQSNGTVVINPTPEYTPNVHYDTDGYELAVNGDIICESLKVTQNVPNSDHVFADGYRLRPLSEVEAFVTKNKHLPEIPSAKEFQENGYDLGEMDDVLLRKVEELTLYIIALEKKVEQLEAQQNQ